MAPVGSDIYEFRLDTQEVVQKYDIGRAGAFGFGRRNAAMWYETSPSSYDAVYFTKNPVIERAARCPASRSDRSWTSSTSPSRRTESAFISAGMTSSSWMLRTRRILAHKEGFERGRANTGWVASEDGSKLIVGGVGDRLKIYDEDTLELIEEKILEGDAMFAPFPLPRRPVENASQ